MITKNRDSVNDKGLVIIINVMFSKICTRVCGSVLGSNQIFIKTIMTDSSSVTKLHTYFIMVDYWNVEDECSHKHGNDMALN